MKKRTNLSLRKLTLLITTVGAMSVYAQGTNNNIVISNDVLNVDGYSQPAQATDNELEHVRNELHRQKTAIQINKEKGQKYKELERTTESLAGVTEEYINKRTNARAGIDNNILDFNDEQLAFYRNSCVGFMFQFHFLLPSMTCLNNVLLPAKIGGHKLSVVTKRVQKIASYLGVDHCLSKFPYELSGGEQQRINLIRSISLKPKLLLCDEPTGNLDSANSQKVLELILSFSKEIGCSLLLVTHSADVSRCFEHKISIEDGQIIS